MNFESLQLAWRSANNNPNAAAQAYLINEAQAAVNAQRQHLRGTLIFAGVMLLTPLALLAIELLSGQSDTIDLTREWALIPFALIPFVVLVVIAHQQRAQWQQLPNSSTLLDSFRALRAENNAARRRIHMIGAALLLFAPLIAVMLKQLILVGKMAPGEMHSAAIVMGGALALSATWMVIKYVYQLIPEGHRLDALIAQYEAQD